MSELENGFRIGDVVAMGKQVQGFIDGGGQGLCHDHDR